MLPQEPVEGSHPKVTMLSLTYIIFRDLKSSEAFLSSPHDGLNKIRSRSEWLTRDLSEPGGPRRADASGGFCSPRRLRGDVVVMKVNPLEEKQLLTPTCQDPLPTGPPATLQHTSISTVKPMSNPGKEIL